MGQAPRALAEDRARTSLDPMTLEVVRHALEETAEAMNVALMLAAYSTNITDRRDSSCAIYLPSIEAVAQSQTGTPLHLGVMPYVVRTILSRISVDAMIDGDQYIMNTPYPEGPGHLNDIALLKPVFHDGRVIAFVVNQAHHVDVGGIVPGSISGHATEIFQEGLQLPPVRLISQGEIVDDILAIFVANIRSPEISRGDLLAQAAANNVGADRLSELILRWGAETLVDGMRTLLTQAERRTRAAIAELPNGEYAAEDYIEGPDGPITVRVVVTVGDDSIDADFSGTDDEVLAPLNCRIPTLHAALAYVVMAMVEPGMSPNAGALRALRATSREGTLVNARYPHALVQANLITSQRITDVLIKALHQAAPERTVAACAGTTSLVVIGGQDPVRQERFTYIEAHGGGCGGAPDREGESAVQTHMTNSLNSPIEVLEQTFPFRILQYELKPHSAGDGRWRGGYGMRKQLQLDVPATVTVAFARVDTQPWGLEGGMDGASARVFLTRAGKTERLPGRGTFAFQAGDILILESPGGGGYGPCEERELSSIARDVEAELLDVDDAQRVYGWDPAATHNGSPHHSEGA